MNAKEEKAVWLLRKNGAMSGEELRKAINSEPKGWLEWLFMGVRLAKFYRMMSKLEDKGLVRGWYVDKNVRGHVIRERTYCAI